MTERMEHFDEDLEASARLSADLNTLFKPQLSVPPEVDRAILDRAHTHFTSRELAKSGR